MLRKYELMYILRNDSPSDLTQATIQKVKNTITEQNGTILLHESWGKRRLAYEIKKVSKGFYMLTTFAAEPTAIQEIEHVLRIHPEVIRWLTVQLDDHVIDLDAEIKKYAEVTPKMVPIEGEATEAPARPAVTPSDPEKPEAKKEAEAEASKKEEAEAEATDREAPADAAPVEEAQPESAPAPEEAAEEVESPKEPVPAEDDESAGSPEDQAQEKTDGEEKAGGEEEAGKE